MAGQQNHFTRGAILRFLKMNGESEAKDIAQHCGLTTMAVSRHLLNLQADRLIESRMERRPRGRPTTIYGLTKNGDAEFPREYGSLACDLLSSLRELDGEEKVNRVFEKRREQMTLRYRNRLKGRPVGEKVREAAVILSECGFMADVSSSADGSMVLTEHNCAIRGVAECFPAACQQELKFLRGLIGAPVKRISHLLGGDRNCSYLIKVKNSEGRLTGGAKGKYSHTDTEQRSK